MDADPNDVATWGPPAPVTDPSTPAPSAAPATQSLPADESWGEPQDYVATVDAEQAKNASSLPYDESWGDPTPLSSSTEPPLTSSPAGDVARGIGRRVGMGAAGGVGAEAGYGIGEAAAPFLAAIPYAGPALAVAAPYAGAAVGGLVAGNAGQSLQQWIINKLGLDKGTGFFSNAQEQADEAQHPYLTFASELAPSALSFGGAEGAIARGVGAAGMAGMEVGNEAINDGSLDPTKIAIAGGAGALLGGPRDWAKGVGSKVAGPVTRAFRPGRPDTAAPDAAADKATTDQANDMTPVSIGVAQENGPPVKNPDTTGNPDGAPMAARVASPPSAATRDFGKKPTTAPSDQGVNTDTIHPDLATALGELNDNGEQSNSVAPAPAVLPAADNAAGHAMGDVAGGVPAAPGGTPNPESLPIDTGLAEASRQVAPANDLTGEAAQNAQIKTASQLSPNVDPVEASQLQRQQAADLQARQAAQQQGEAFQQPANVPQSKALVETLKHMRADPETAGTADELEKMPTAQANVIARKYMALVNSKTGRATGETTRRGGMPTKRAELGGVQTGGGERGARKAAAVQAVKDVFASFNDKPLPLDRGGVVYFAKQIVSQARESNKGVDPAGAYRVTPAHENYPQFKWYKAARAVADKPTSKNIQEFQALHAAKGTDASTNVDADIAMKRTPTSDALAEVAPDKEQLRPRPDYEPLAPTQAGDDYVSKSNDLRDFVNKLSPEDWKMLDEDYPAGLDHEIVEGNEPGDLLKELRQTLETSKRPVAPRTPAARVTAPVTDRFSETEPGAPASTGKSLKGTPEWEALAQQYGGPAKAKDPSGLRANQTTLSSGLPIKGAVDELWNRAKSMAGSAPSARKLLGFMFGRPKNPAAEQVGKDLTKQFNINEGAMNNTDSRLTANFAAGAPALTPDEWNVVGRKLQDRTAMTPKEQDAVDKYVKPLQKWRDRLYAIKRRSDPSLPATYNQGAVEQVPRLIAPDTEPRNNNMPWRRTLNDFSPALEERDFVALDDKNGKRFVFKNNGDGTGTVWKNGKPVKMHLPDDFTGKPGEKLDKYTVDNASTQEIMKQMPDMKYVENPLIAYSNSIRSIHASVLKDNLLKRLKTNPMLEQFSTTVKEDADKWGYKPTQLAEIAKRNGKTVYYDPRLAWRLDDFGRPGVNDDVFESVRRAAQTMAKPLYFIAPGFHPLNVAANWGIGTAGLTARAAPMKMAEVARRMLPDLADSYKSVLRQDKLQEEIRAAGGRTMYNSTLVDHGVINDMMKQAGIQIAQRPELWRGFAKSLGMGDKVQDLPHQLMRKSNKITWMANDVLLTSMYKTARRIGMEPNQAVDAIHNYIGSYRADNPTMFGQGNAGRVMQKIVNEPAFSWFGPYHQDLWNTMGHMWKGAVDPAAPGDRREALGALAGLGLLTYGVYPSILDPFAKWVTGNKDASFGRRGVSALAQLPADFAAGNPDAYTRLGENIITPSIPANMLMEGRQNQDWKGAHIAVPGAPAALQAGQVADWAARNAIPPYSTAAALARQHGVTVGQVLRKMAESTIGLREPTPGSAKFMHKLPGYDRTQLNERVKRPEGFIEKAVNSVTGR